MGDHSVPETNLLIAILPTLCFVVCGSLFCPLSLCLSPYAVPDFIEQDLCDDDLYIVMGSDGLWDVMTNQQVVDFVDAYLYKDFNPDDVCKDLGG